MKAVHRYCQDMEESVELSVMGKGNEDNFIFRGACNKGRYMTLGLARLEMPQSVRPDNAYPSSLSQSQAHPSTSRLRI